MKENEYSEYYTRMSLKQDRGWTDKMIKILLANVEYKECGNYYGRNGLIRKYKISDIERIEKTKEYQELREKVDIRRKKAEELKKIQLEEQKKAEEKRLIDLSKLYEDDEYVKIDNNNKSHTKVKWQESCLQEITDKNNILLSSPTSSGKTLVFLEWALKKKERPIFITSPIKSLSNQRYRELINANYVVSIETGDVQKILPNSEIICCTQEIYTNKYINMENSTLILDEFHYIFEDTNRARTYIDALNYSKSKNIFICSATLGNLEKLKEYIDRISGRNFYIYENKEKLTELIYNQNIDYSKIKNSLVIAFSVSNCRYIAEKLAELRNKIKNVNEKVNNRYNSNFEKITKLAQKYNISDKSSFNMDNLKCGISVYYGSLLPKEKSFIEEIFENGLIDTVVGTDALALGVNFPVKNVVFIQLSKDNYVPISKNLFEQISGRAGRKGYFDTGYVYYCNNFCVINSLYDNEYFYNELLHKKHEDINIILLPVISKILKKDISIQEEAKYIVNNSTEKLDIQNVFDYINYDIKKIFNYKVAKDIQEEFKNNIADVYFDEYDAETNCQMFSCILCDNNLKNFFENNLSDYSFNKLLQLRRYLKHLPKKYRDKINIKELESKINSIDNTALTV